MQTRPQVPGYRLGELIARGSSAAVWAATGRHGDEDLAIKVVPLPPGDDGDALSAELSALAMTRTPDDHLVTVVEVVAVADPAPGVAIVMERLRHGTLTRLVGTRGHLTPAEVVTVLTPVALTVARLHDTALVHGDLAPSNVGFDGRGRPVLLDLGVSSVIGTPKEEIYGTPGFVAPEVVAGGQPTPSSDVYAIGALGWFALTGEAPPIPAERPPLADLLPQVPALMREALEQALHPHPERRGDGRALASAISDSSPAAPIEPGEGDDPATLLTHRVRELARAPASEPDGSAGSRRERRTELRRRSRTSDLRVVSAFVAAVVMGGAGIAAAQAGRDTALTAAASDATGPVGPPGPVAAPRPGQGATTQPDATAAPAAAAAPAATNAPGPDMDYAGLVESLVAARAQAWNSGSAEALAASFEPGSVAYRQDSVRLGQAAEAGHRYDGLRFTVSELRLRTESIDLVRVEATITTSAYAVHTSAADSSSVQQRRQSAARVALTLVRGESGWRISVVEPVNA